jgi:hypothetical protein
VAATQSEMGSIDGTWRQRAVMVMKGVVYIFMRLRFGYYEEICCFGFIFLTCSLLRCYIFLGGQTMGDFCRNQTEIVLLFIIP